MSYPEEKKYLQQPWGYLEPHYMSRKNEYITESRQSASKCDCIIVVTKKIEALIPVIY